MAVVDVDQEHVNAHAQELEVNSALVDRREGEESLDNVAGVEFADVEDVQNVERLVKLLSGKLVRLRRKCSRSSRKS